VDEFHPQIINQTNTKGAYLMKSHQTARCAALMLGLTAVGTVSAQSNSSTYCQINLQQPLVAMQMERDRCKKGDQTQIVGVVMVDKGSVAATFCDLNYQIVLGDQAIFCVFAGPGRAKAIDDYKPIQLLPTAPGRR
jgi:hypothetical protein